MAVYAGDVRTDSALIGSASPIQPCYQFSYSSGAQLCNLPPGTYTLVLFSDQTANCTSVRPTIYIAQYGVSRFDHANNAYDFGTVPPDSLWHNGKVGDVNPINPARAPSNDIIYCSTGSQITDPVNGQCATVYTPNMYTADSLWMFKGQYNAAYGPVIPRRTLWYTFVINQPGNIKVDVKSLTAGKGLLHFSIFRSNVDGRLPFSTVVSSGQVDSTISQGLSFIATNNQACPYFFPGPVSFYRDACSFTGPERYYILVENRWPWSNPIEEAWPNQQLVVSVLADSISTPPTKFDHYSQAYDFGSIAAGNHTGATDNFSCATKDVTDPVYYYTACTKTLWYKFTTTVTGNLRYRINVNGSIKYSYDALQLFRQTIAGDSTSSGLTIQNISNSVNYYDNVTKSFWAQTCVSAGTYYLLLTGCNQANEYVYAEIEMIEQAGDFCAKPVIATLNGAGATNATAIVDCHTIGTDYGEFNPTLTCPVGGTTSQYKSSWFRLDITGKDTLDVTTYISENTNVNPGDIKYRMMTGNCGAMQEQSCVLDALTQNTYKCLTAGSYYFRCLHQSFFQILDPGLQVISSCNYQRSLIATHALQ